MPGKLPILGEVVPETDPARLPGPEPLRGQHVTLVRLSADHYSHLWEHIGSRPEIWTFWPDDAPSTPSEFDDYMDRLLQLSTDLASYAVLPLGGPFKDQAVGLALALSEDRETNRVGEMGLFYGLPLQGSRAGTEAAYITAKHLFELGHRRVGWKTSNYNLPSRKAAERFGFVYEGTLRQHQINKGRNRDTVWYSIIDSEWPLCRAGFEKWLHDDNFDEQQRQIKSLQEIRKLLAVNEDTK